MPLLLLTVLAASPISDPRGFSFELPEGFSAFPGFTPNGNKLYAFGKNLGTPSAITLAIDGLDAAPKGPSENCSKLRSIDRTVNSPLKEQWNGAELVGVRMEMEQMFGKIVVLCLDVPTQPKSVTLMVSGKPENEAALRQAFSQTLASLSGNEEPRQSPLPLVLAASLSVLFLFFFVRRIRGSASRSSR